MTKSESFYLAAMLTFSLIVLGLVVRDSVSCYSTGGTVVRGLIWLECIR